MCEHTDIVLAAVQDDFVATARAGDEFQGIDEVEAQLAALHRFGYGNVFDVAHNTSTANELALDEDGATSNKLINVRK